MKQVKARRQLTVLVLVLSTLGISAVLYKHFSLGFPLLASETQEVWQVESRISFTALGGPTTVKLNMPDSAETLRPIFSRSLAPEFEFSIDSEDGRHVAQWQREDAPAGETQVMLYNELFFAELPDYAYPAPETLEPATLNDTEAAALQAVQEYIAESGLAGPELVMQVLREMNNPTSDIWALLQRESDKPDERLQLAVDILAFQGIAAMPVRGLLLKDRQRNRSAKRILLVYLDESWQAFDPGAAEPIAKDEFLPFQRGDESLFEVEGGENSRLEFSMIKVQRAKFLNAVEDARNHRSVLIDFSIYSLPVEQQSTFKLLLLIPLGALVVVILRNLVGIRTSGTFMPILIALTFLQTTLLTGLVLFLIVVSLGLLLRSYLTNLNLLLVPRIASVLVFVIIIYAAIGIVSHKLGLEWGMAVTFFPMIILAWTIERMSILWDEEGPREVFIQGGGSLLTASIAYVVMSNELVADSIFLYPEALLIVLAVIIAIGSYSGYRLSDLRRFEPMERY